MRLPMRGAALLLLSLLVALGACKKDKGKQAAPGVSAAGRGRVEVPKEVLVTIGLKNPAKTIDEGLALAREFTSVPFTRAGLLDLFAQRAKLPRELVDAIDVEKPLWLVGLDDTLVKDRDPMVTVFSLRSRKAFEAALAQKLKAGGSDGKLTIYKPKPGAVGLHEVRLRITDTHVWTASSGKAYETAEAFVEGNLLPQPPPHDLEVRLMVAHILRVRGEDLDKKLDRALDKMRSGGTSGPMDREQVASATAKTVRRWAEALKSTREARITAEVNREQITVALRGTGIAGGRLEKLVKRQRVGEPFGYKLLPASSWLVVADRNNPEAQDEDRNTWEPIVGEILKGMAEAEREAVLAAVRGMAAQMTGDFSLALHRPPAGGGLTLSWIGRVTDGAKARQATTNLAGALGAWVKAMMARDKKQAPKGLKVKRRAFAHGKAKGEIFELHLAVADEKREQIGRVLGLPVTLAVAFSGTHGLLCLGQGAEAQLKLLAEGAEADKPAGGLEGNPAFERARAAGRNRTGMLYLSLLDLLRWFEGTGLKEVETIAKALKGAQVSSAPSLDWGVNEARTELDLTLRLPAEHFRPFKPILQELQRRRRWTDL